MALSTSTAGDRREVLGAAADESDTPQVVSVVGPARMDVDPVALSTADDEEVAFWEQPERGVAIFGRGAAVALTPDATRGRFSSVADAARSLFHQLHVIRAGGTNAGPVLIGGFSFHDGTAWTRHGSGRMVLPELAYVRLGGRAAWVRSLAVAPGSDPADLVAGAREDLRRLAGLGGGWVAPGRLAGVQPVAPSDSSYPALVQAAIDEIGSGRLDKVVVARSVEIDDMPDPPALLAILRDRYPGCATFMIRSGDEAFVGSTPELLARLTHGFVETAAVAGTAARGEDLETDTALAVALFNDRKEREEHRIVYEDIRGRLRAAGVTVDAKRQPDVLKLPGLQHLYSRVTGETGERSSILDIVGALHPTPAVAGIPTRESVAWLAENEGFDRGWYAGPIGYMTLAGEGEFRVALRSGLLSARGTRLFAGAGIVAASDPERELAETELKLQALGRAARSA